MNRWNLFCTNAKQNVAWRHARTATMVKSTAQAQSAGGHVKLVVGCQIMVATSALGMGVDSPFVRSVIHVGYARSLLDYAQQSGRAGRDGLPAKCILLYSNQLLARERHVVTSFPSDQVLDMHKDQRHVLLGLQSSEQVDISRKMRDLSIFQSYAQGSSKCRRQIIFGYLDQNEPSMYIFTQTRKQRGPVPMANPVSISDKTPPTPSAVPFVPCKHGSTECPICTLCPLCDFCTEIQDNISAPTLQAQAQAEPQLLPSVRTPPLETPSQTSPSLLLCTMTHRKTPHSFPSLDGNWLSSNLAMFQGPRNLGVATTGSQYGTQPSNTPAARTKHDVQSIAHAFKQSYLDLKDYCLLYLVGKGGIKVKATDCVDSTCKRHRCFSCQQLSHQKDCCELIPFRPLPQTLRKYPPADEERKNHCYACGLDKWMRVGLHEPAEFSRVRSFPYAAAFQLPAIAWEHPERHKQIVEVFQLDILDSRTDLTQALRDVFFFKELRETNRQDNHRLHLMQILDFLCKLQ